MDYRSRIYERYSSIVQGVSAAPILEEVDRWGDAYDTYMRGWLPDKMDAPIVDVACGYGRLLRFFAKRGYTNVLGVDISQEQVDIARKVHPNVQQGGVIEFLEQNRNSFALVTAFDIIEHLHKDEALRFLDACHGALQPGGRLIIQTPNADTPWGLGIRYGDFTHEIGFNPHSLGWLMRLCRFGSFEAREQGPVPHGATSTVRFLLWKLMRLKMMIWNMVETGGKGSGVFTRVFIARGLRA